MDSGVLMLWIVGGLITAFMFYVLIDAWLVARKRRRQVAEMIGDEEGESPQFEPPPAQRWSDFLEGTCQQCRKTVYVPKMRRFKPFLCPDCQSLNPALKKDSFSPAKKFLRWLLYPSFQDRF